MDQKQTVWNHGKTGSFMEPILMQRSSTPISPRWRCSRQADRADVKCASKHFIRFLPHSTPGKRSHMAIDSFLPSVGDFLLLTEIWMARIGHFRRSFGIKFNDEHKGTPPIKKSISFGHFPKRGGGGPCPNFFTLFSTMLSLIF